MKQFYEDDFNGSELERIMSTGIPADLPRFRASPSVPTGRQSQISLESPRVVSDLPHQSNAGNSNDGLQYRPTSRSLPASSFLPQSDPTIKREQLDLTVERSPPTGSSALWRSVLPLCDGEQHPVLENRRNGDNDRGLTGSVSRRI